jgi:DNA-binding CsgD family transcriptional regulator
MQTKSASLAALPTGHAEPRGGVRREAESARAPDPTTALDAFFQRRLRLVAITPSAQTLHFSIRRQGVYAHVLFGAKERRIVALLLEGASQKQIAFELGISLSTVNVCLHGMLRKLEVKCTEHLVLLARAIGGLSEAQLVAMSEHGARAEAADDTSDLDFRVAVDAAAMGQLTAAEEQVALHVLEGRSNADIARIRGRSERTVANQVAAVFRKLGTSGRVELVRRLVGARLRSQMGAAAGPQTRAERAADVN